MVPFWTLVVWLLTELNCLNKKKHTQPIDNTYALLQFEYRALTGTTSTTFVIFPDRICTAPHTRQGNCLDPGGLVAHGVELFEQKKHTQPIDNTYSLPQFEYRALTGTTTTTFVIFPARICTAPHTRQGNVLDPGGLVSHGVELFEQKKHTQPIDNTYALLQFEYRALTDTTSTTFVIFPDRICTAPHTRQGNFFDPGGLVSYGVELFEQKKHTQPIDNTYALLQFEYRALTGTTSTTFVIFPDRICTAPHTRQGNCLDPGGLVAYGVELFEQKKHTQPIDNTYTLPQFEYRALTGTTTTTFVIFPARICTAPHTRQGNCLDPRGLVSHGVELFKLKKTYPTD
jgi:V8-like Glu-specific endopeptidase